MTLAPDMQTATAGNLADIERSLPERHGGTKGSVRRAAEGGRGHRSVLSPRSLWHVARRLGVRQMGDGGGREVSRLGARSPGSSG